jgi:tetrapyrrole methylase family protein/MazG family protein
MLNAGDLQSVLAILESQSVDSLQVLSAPFVAAQHYPRLDPSQPVLLLGCSPRPLLSRLQQTLMLAYPPEHLLTIIPPDGDSYQMALDELAEMGDSRGASRPSGSAFSILIHPLPAASTYEALQDVAAHLRAPDGCPWDRALTWAKLRPSLLEETYELLAALDQADTDKVTEELGDLLLQVVMQTQIAAEEGLFRLPDVIRLIVDKLIRRHPHVFGDTVVSGTDEVLANWEAIKAAERIQNGEQGSPLAGVPAGLPALAQADAYLDRMSRLRVAHTPEAPWAPLADLPPEVEVKPELVGEVLLGMVAWARARGVDAESALRRANARYAARIAGEEAGGANASPIQAR